MMHWHRHEHTEPAAEQAPERDSAQIEILRVFAGEDGQGGIPIGLIRRRDVTQTDPTALVARCGVDCLVIFDDPLDGSATAELFAADGPLDRSSAGCLALGWWLTTSHTPVTAVLVAGTEFTVAQSAHFGWVSTDPAAGRDPVLHRIDDVELIEKVTADELPERTECVWAYCSEKSDTLLEIKRMTPESDLIAAASTALTARLGHGTTLVDTAGIHVVTSMDAQGRILLGGRVSEDRVVVL
ncbi:hypothetical protein KO481_30000 [Nocardia sp. NEAU-G5]|uniref:Uncharacterized protein n=1 Tax=Nocardia albiluteola TaxID=2842303 RepID=A0ABS6B7M8_9NOCA|nr:hypothetical protein [Nocardia albiluteola]MBU3065746.1 hypothetical protein [Nocardia albiluteola]